MKITNIQRWGNSLGIRIPSAIAKKLSLHPGVIIEIRIKDGQIVLYPKKDSLSDMVKLITEKNRHDIEWQETDIKGAEEW